LPKILELGEGEREMAGFRVGIIHEGKQGMVTYDAQKKEFRVEHPEKSVVERVIAYLNTKQKFRIPESNRLDDFRVDIVLPGESKMYAELALSSMYGKTGVMVAWDKGNLEG
jgi:hypothetical protein